MTGLSTKELKNTAKELRGDISTLIRELDPLFKAVKVACDALASAKKEYASALAAFEKKENPKTTAKHDKAKESLTSAYGNYSDALAALEAKNNEITVKYTRLVEVAEAISERECNKAKGERDSYVNEYELRLSKAERGIADNLPAFLTEKPAAPVAEPTAAEPTADAAVTEEPKTEPVRPEASATVTSVNVAPITIDISTYVERAISATMDRLTVGMERKIAAYIDSLVIPKPELPTAPAPVAPVATDATADTAVTEAIVTTSKANNELLGHILEEQTHVYEKLRGMITNVQSLVDGMTEVTASYMTLAEKNRELVEAQKQVNDMQRHTAREQQGVQVNQKMINEEQINISAEQALLADKQAAILARQKSLAESQVAMEETQKAVMDTHLALEEAMKTVMLAQKDIIATQQAIISGNAKNQEAQKLIIEKQAEITAAQKEALAAHKQLLKEQKAHNDKLGISSAKKAKKPADDPDEPPTVVDGTVVTEKSAPAPDVSALAADDEVHG